MKKIYSFILSALFVGAFAQINAQTVVDFEDLSLESESFYNGASDHSGTANATETFDFVSGNVTFPLSCTDWGGYISWNGVAYSNQTDVNTAALTNYSAYASPAGGANASANYGVAYLWGEGRINFSSVVDLTSVQIANHAWTYHYMMGTDGAGTGTFEAGDSLTLVFYGYDSDDQKTDSVYVYLADYTDGNTDIINNWTNVDLSNLEGVASIGVLLKSNDGMCPTYFCMDNLIFQETPLIITFDDLDLEANTYYNGSANLTDDVTSGIFAYQTGGASVNVSCTDYGGFIVWSGFSYSNQTDLTTADWNNYSAYASPAGGANGTENYGFHYSGTESIEFENPVNLQSVYLTNTTWAYHYIMGTDGSGSGTYEAGDSLVLRINGYNADEELINTVYFYLADFTDGNNTVIDNWTEVDLSSLQNVSKIRLLYSSSDNMTPYYVGIDELSYSVAPVAIAADFDVDATACSDNEIVFDNQSTTNGETVTYQWSINDVELATTEDLTHTFTNIDETQTFTVKLTMTGEGISEEYSQDIVVYPTFNSIETEQICNGDSVLWRGSYYKVAGEFTDELTTVNGCDSIYTLNVEVLELPQVFTVTGGGEYPENGEGVTIGLSGSQEGIAYGLLLGEDIVATVPGDGNAIDFGLQTAQGVYFVGGVNLTTECISIMEGSATITIVTDLTLSTLNELSIYPNPFNEFVIVECDQNAIVFIADASGKLIKNVPVEPGKNRIETSDFPAGVYMLTVQNQNGKIVRKIIK